MHERWRDLAVAGHTGDVELATAALLDPDPVARELALGALERLGELGDDHLHAALDDPVPAVRRRAAELAAKHPLVDLRIALDDTDATVQEMAAWACGEQVDIPAPTFEALVSLATASSVALVREAAIAALGAIGADAGLPAILAGCRDQPTVRRRAVLALAPFDGDEVEAAIAAALTDRDWQVRQAAEDLVRASHDPGHATS
ncbi:MAG: HEAT repeat domain-containing protein [Acidimicrobiales bacterium]|nr:HEAT repeat domain-containing protein [Acidimicrobiales bacterium]MCB9395793.1 HEAT repeat domain-containing protein [Acidimicrobiaceae bacterium]